MTKQEILELIKDVKELGLKSIEIEGIKVEFTNNTQTDSVGKNSKVPDDQKAEDLVAKPNPYDELTDEEILYWSSGYGIELSEQRKQEQSDALQRKVEDDTKQ